MKKLILYEDNHLLVLNKPAGMLTQPNDTSTPNLLELARSWLKEVYQKPGNVFLEPIHRIDRPVSGVVVFCKTSKSLSRMNQFIRERATKKIYWACVEGVPEKEEDRLEDWLVHDDFHARIVSPSFPQAKKASLSYRILSEKKGKTLLEIELETGRYHQIRVQMAGIRCPILGDFKYGSREGFMEGAIALVHKIFEIPHPITKELMVFEVPLADIPAIFKN